MRNSKFNSELKVTGPEEDLKKLLEAYKNTKTQFIQELGIPVPQKVYDEGSKALFKWMSENWYQKYGTYDVRYSFKDPNTLIFTFWTSQFGIRDIIGACLHARYKTLNFYFHGEDDTIETNKYSWEYKSDDPLDLVYAKKFEVCREHFSKMCEHMNNYAMTNDEMHKNLLEQEKVQIIRTMNNDPKKSEEVMKKFFDEFRNRGVLLV